MHVFRALLSVLNSKDSLLLILTNRVRGFCTVNEDHMLISGITHMLFHLIFSRNSKGELQKTTSAK